MSQSDINESLLFKKWLMEECNLSEKVASNQVSRCRRIQKIIAKNLHDEILANKTDNILEEIDYYVINNTTSVKSAYSLRGTLKHAFRKYYLFTIKNLIMKSQI